MSQTKSTAPESNSEVTAAPVVPEVPVVASEKKPNLETL